MEIVNFEAELSFGKAYLLKDSQSVGTWIVEGYASTSDLDAQRHIVDPEAIKMGAESLKRYDTVLFNHDPNRPIGKVLHSEATDGGLLVKVAVSKTEPKIWDQIKEGTLSKFSIRGQITDSEIREDQLTKEEIFVIKGMELHEISLVSVPANPHARSLAWYIEKALAEKKEYRKPGESVQDCITRKIKMNMDEGMPHDRAVAAAHSMCGAAKKDDEVKKDQDNFEEAIEYLEAGVTNLKGEDADQVMSIIRSLQALIGRVYAKSIDAKGGQEIVADSNEEIKKEAVAEEEVKKVEEPKEEEVKKADPVKEEPKQEVKKSEEPEKVALDLSVLKDVISQLQTMVKEVTTQSDTVKSLSADVGKAKTDIEKMLSDLTSVMKEIPIRKGQAPEKEEERPKMEKSLAETDEYKKANPFNQLHMLVKRAAGEK